MSLHSPRGSRRTHTRTHTRAHTRAHIHSHTHGAGLSTAYIRALGQYGKCSPGPAPTRRPPASRGPRSCPNGASGAAPLPGAPLLLPAPPRRLRPPAWHRSDFPPFSSLPNCSGTLLGPLGGSFPSSGQPRTLPAAHCPRDAHGAAAFPHVPCGIFWHGMGMISRGGHHPQTCLGQATAEPESKLGT